MTHDSPSWSRPQALLVLTTLIAMTAACLAVARTQVTRPVEERPGDTDADLFRKVVLRVHAGETLYDAFEHVFREYDYPVRSVLNYRTPLHLWLIGQLPGPRWGQVLLALVMLATALMSFAVMSRDVGVPGAAVGVLMMLGTFVYGFVADTYLYSEVWSGTLIALSVTAYALERRSLGWGAGLLALFFRELALPYVLVCLVLAVSRGQRREAFAWMTGLAAYGVYFALHVLAVAPRIPPAGGLVNGAGWVRFGGLAFVLATCRINLLLLAAPGWLTAIVLPLSLLGLWGGRDACSERVGLVVGLYLGAFSIVGGLFNAYWGLLYAPLLPFGLVRAPAVIRELGSSVFPRSAGFHLPV